jgi:hypothetical protein
MQRTAPVPAISKGLENKQRWLTCWYRAYAMPKALSIPNVSRLVLSGVSGSFLDIP